MRISCDLGGTNVRFATQNDPSGGLNHSRSFPCDDFEDFHDALRSYLQELGKDNTSFSICIGMAGPCSEILGTLSNRDWQISTVEIKREFGATDVVLLNDIELLNYGIAKSLQTNDLNPLIPLLKHRRSNEHCVSLTIGTGMGQGFFSLKGNCLHTFASEGSHGNFAPHTDEEIRLLQFVQQRSSSAFVSWEHLVSGMYGFSSLLDLVCSSRMVAEFRDIPVKNNIRCC